MGPSTPPALWPPPGETGEAEKEEAAVGGARKEEAAVAGARKAANGVEEVADSSVRDSAQPGDLIVGVIPLIVQSEGELAATPLPIKPKAAKQIESPPVPRRPKAQAKMAGGAQATWDARLDARKDSKDGPAQMAHADLAAEEMDVSTPASRPPNVGVVSGLQVVEVRKTT